MVLKTANLDEIECDAHGRAGNAVSMQAVCRLYSEGVQFTGTLDNLFWGQRTQSLRTSGSNGAGGGSESVTGVP